MYYADIKYPDIANGLGVRVSLFVSGCRRHCPECFNKEAQDFKYGSIFTDKEVKRIEDYLKLPQVSGLTLLGGEPMEPENRIQLLPLCRYFKEHYPEKSIWCYTGYLFDDELVKESKQNTVLRLFLQYIDVMVDGPFINDLKDISLRFRGSSNQRIIDVQKSLQENKVVLYELPNN